MHLLTMTPTIKKRRIFVKQSAGKPIPGGAKADQTGAYL
jgi:hypothetical protein